MSGHPHADLMAKAAEIAKADKEWYRHFEIKTPSFNAWSEMCNEVFLDNDEYRLKPRYIKIGEYQVPEPVREPLQAGQEYWVADVARWDDEWLWDDDNRDNLWLERGLIHLTKEAAYIHIAALLSFTQK
ncbi:hypothetical protein H8R13_18140 [Morganella morganii]|uniref:hypothetical protein n=1 Tax=Morganella morganii TaxID=582 RepID=UPI00164A55B7|nr:hypothetical protein [Morganella morganii]MBC4013637.1 hypothetical protein [Morganella morganii]